MRAREVLAVCLVFATAFGGTAEARAEPGRAPGPNYERAVQVVRTGPQWLSVDLELLSRASPALEDLRLLDASEHEVPFLLIAPKNLEPRWVNASRLFRAVTDPKESGFEADFGKLWRCDQVRIEGLTAPFMKRLRLEASGNRQQYISLATDATLFDLPDLQLKNLRLFFDAGDYRYLRLIWDDKNSGPVGLPETVALRLVDDRNPRELSRTPIRFEKRLTRGPRSQFWLRLPGRGLPIASVELVSRQAQVLRQARISETILVDGRLESHELGAATLRRTEKEGLVAADLKIPIHRPAGHELLLTVDDGDNPPLSIDQIQVELLPQPGIYFVAKDLGPYRFRYGDPKAQAPRYDLEAERDSIGLSALAQAKWVENAHPINPSVVKQSIPESREGWSRGSPLDASKFSYRRPITGDSQDLVSVRLDAAVLAHSSDLRDLRVVDAKLRQVPYLVERESEPLIIDLPMSQVAPQDQPKGLDPRATVYRLTLPFENLPAGQLELVTHKRVFRRSVAVYAQGRGNPSGQSTLEKVVETEWTHGDPSQEPPTCDLALSPAAPKTLLLVIEDGDNERLPLASTRLRLESRSVRFFRKPGEALSLAYGNTSLSAPDYDLTLLTEELRELPTRELGLGNEVARVPTVPPITEVSRWFWGIVVVTVLGLIAFIARLITKGEPSD